MFEVRCQECQSPFEVDERRVPRSGMQMRCPKCNTSFLVKRPAAAGAAPAPPPVPASASRGPSAGGPPKPPAPPPAVSISKAGVPTGAATMLGAGVDLPLPLDPHAALPMPKDLVGLPAVRDFSLDLPAVAEPAALPAVRDFALDLPTTVDREGPPAVIDFGGPADSARRPLPSSAGIPGGAPNTFLNEPIIEGFTRKKNPTPEYGSKVPPPPRAFTSDDLEHDEADLPLGPEDAATPGPPRRTARGDGASARGHPPAGDR